MHWCYIFLFLRKFLIHSNKLLLCKGCETRGENINCKELLQNFLFYFSVPRTTSPIADNIWLGCINISPIEDYLLMDSKQHP